MVFIIFWATCFTSDKFFDGGRAGCSVGMAFEIPEQQELPKDVSSISLPGS